MEYFFSMCTSIAENDSITCKRLEVCEIKILTAFFTHIINQSPHPKTHETEFTTGPLNII